MPDSLKNLHATPAGHGPLLDACIGPAHAVRLVECRVCRLGSGRAAIVPLPRRHGWPGTLGSRFLFRTRVQGTGDIFTGV